jgi:hypothetical protein
MLQRSATVLLLATLLLSAFAFVPSPHPPIERTRLMAEKQAFELMVDLPGGKDLSAKMKFMPVLDGPSEIVEVRYQVSSNRFELFLLVYIISTITNNMQSRCHLAWMSPLRTIWQSAPKLERVVNALATSCDTHLNGRSVSLAVMELLQPP